MNEHLMVSGTITKSTYESLKPYIIPPLIRFVTLGVIAVYDVWMVYQMCVGDFLPHLIMMLGFTALMVYMFFHTRSSAVKRQIQGNTILRSGEAIHLTIHFEDQGIRMFNHTMGRERSMRYNEFATYADTSRCIALYVKKGNFLMVPKDEMSDETRDQILALLKKKNPKLRKRL